MGCDQGLCTCVCHRGQVALTWKIKMEPRAQLLGKRAAEPSARASDGASSSQRVKQTAIHQPLPDLIVQVPNDSVEIGVTGKHGRDKTTSILKVDAHQELGKGCPHRFPRLPPDEMLSALTLLRICPFLARLRISPDRHHMGNLVIAQESKGGPPNTFDICRGCLRNFRRAIQTWPWCIQSAAASGLHCHSLSHSWCWLSYLPQSTCARDTSHEAIKVYEAWNDIPCDLFQISQVLPPSPHPPVITIIYNYIHYYQGTKW